MATPKTANDDAGMVTGMFYDRDSAERAYRSIIGRGYDQDESISPWPMRPGKCSSRRTGSSPTLAKRPPRRAWISVIRKAARSPLSPRRSAPSARLARYASSGVGVVLAGPVAAAIAGAAAAGVPEG
jgi:hypothetical protein